MQFQRSSLQHHVDLCEKIHRFINSQYVFNISISEFNLHLIRQTLKSKRPSEKKTFDSITCLKPFDFRKDFGVTYFSQHRCVIMFE